MPSRFSNEQGLSVDLVSTSETNVTVSLDPTANTLDSAALDRLTSALGCLCRVEIFGPCACLSLLGHNIRGILHELGSAFELFQDQKIYLVTQAANDLNFTFVIDEAQGDRLVQQLHERLIQSIGSDKVLGPTWQQLFAEEKGAPPKASWWEDPEKRRRLIAIAKRESAAFVYDAAALDAAIQAVQGVKSVKRWAYAMKANWHPQILRRVYAAGLTLECVSQGELEHAFASVPDLRPERVLFTPNFAPRAEYLFGFAARRTGHPGQLVSAENVAGRVSRQRDFSAHRSGIWTRPSPACAHRRGSLQIRRASGGG